MTTSLLAYLLGISLLLVASLVEADYQLEVTVHSFSLLRNRCALCYQGNMTEMDQCCDYDAMSPPQSLPDGSCAPQCDVLFTYCKGRELGTPDNSTTCQNPLESSRTGLLDTSGTTLFNSHVLGVPNPVTITSQSRWEGEQFFMEITDHDAVDGGDPADLIDTLAVDVDIPVGASINRTTYTGKYNNTQVELSFRVVCAENYYGPDCTQFCNDSSCPCDPGFTGEFCETNINDCDGVDCSGIGQCVDGINSFVCQCKPGFTGELCETNINNCEGVNCSGHGQCEDGIDSFICQCDPGFTGEFCETNINDCPGIKCSGNGQCVDGINSFICECELGYTGDLCETDIDFCEEVNCSGNGQCMQNFSSFSCQCNPGFTGALCDTSTCDCGPNGQCVVKMDTYTCDCDPGFMGEACEQLKISVCENVSCSGKGRCEESENGATMYRCVCDSGFTGTDCETIIDSCSGANCEGPTTSQTSIGPIIGGIVVTLILVVIATIAAVTIVIFFFHKKPGGRTTVVGTELEMDMDGHYGQNMARFNTTTHNTDQQNHQPNYDIINTEYDVMGYYTTRLQGGPPRPGVDINVNDGRSEHEYEPVATGNNGQDRQMNVERRHEYIHVPGIGSTHHYESVA